LVVSKVNRQVSPDDPIKVADSDANKWVSRGSGKLIGALDAFPAIDVNGRVCVDAGASTGGFTAILLERGAVRVFSIDVGYGQLAWSLQQDPRVVVMDRFNVRHLSAADLDQPADLVVADLSFISLRTVLPALRASVEPSADFVLMVKPQFEVGRERLGKNGVVRDPDVRADAVMGVARSAADIGLGCAGIEASPLPGPSGNVEYFLWLRQDSPPMREDDVARAVADGPK
jgi:23S rRNA (cytidine1920-2'-O)/16S rRNA (cytidine1409-2'-O)-methyltransferase